MCFLLTGWLVGRRLLGSAGRGVVWLHVSSTARVSHSGAEAEGAAVSGVCACGGRQNGVRRAGTCTLLPLSAQSGPSCPEATEQSKPDQWGGEARSPTDADGPRRGVQE